MNKRLLALISILIFVLVACDTNDQASDALSAQNQQPALEGFQTTDLDVAADAVLVTAAGSAVTTGNVPLAAAIQRADALLGCLQDTGSVSGLLYLEEIPSAIIPQTGASLVVNKTRVERNIFACLTDTGFSAQALELEICAVYGEFTVQNDEFYFAYVGAGAALCTGFEQHFVSNLGATVLDSFPPAGQ